MTVPSQPGAPAGQSPTAPTPSPLPPVVPARPAATSSTPPAATRSTPPAATPTIGQLVAQVESSMSTLISSEIELAKLEVTASLKNAGAGVGAFAAAGVLLVFSLTFGLIALAEGLVAAHLWRWAAYLIVFGLLLLVIGLLVFIGIRKVKRVRAPKQTIDTTKESIAYVRSHA